jgi:hypothetical protein
MVGSVQDNNLLLALHTYAAHQDENFTTEAFVHLLRHLQYHEPQIACGIFEFLTGGRIGFERNDCSKLLVTTQWSCIEGTPDIRMTSSEHFVIIEVKVESEPGETQLDRYRERLRQQPEKHKCFTLLSRYPVDQTEAQKVDAHIRWHGIARLLIEEYPGASEPVSRILLQQFLEFLKERGMAMERVGWELGRGVQALLNLTSLLDEAISSSKGLAKRERLGGTGTNGFQFVVNGRKCWSGVYYSSPQVLVFEAYDLPKEATQSAVAGSGRFEKQSKDAFKWIGKLDLESEEVHFFALSSENQQKRLEEFVAINVSQVNKMVSDKKT